MSVQTNMAVFADVMLAGVEDELKAAAPPGRAELDGILERAERLVPPTLAETAALLKLEDQELLEMVLRSAGRVKDTVFGPRVVLFAPLYLSNYCSNDCLYCGFRSSNRAAGRRTLDVGEAVEQASVLAAKGYKRLLLVAGEHPGRSGVDYLVEVAGAIYAKTDIRILHVNCAPLSVEDFKRLKTAGYGVYQCFQETYHRGSYAKHHQSGRKRDFGYRLGAMDRALDAGFGDVGIGSLLGLYDYSYDVLATVAHSRHLEARFGEGAHTISVPRLRHAQGWGLTEAPYPVTDAQFEKIVAVYRLAAPYAGVVVSTREPAYLRDRVLDSGASQISAGSSTEPGGYGGKHESAAQFEITDTRGLSEMMGVIAKRGLLPSLCTSCYRSGRQGAPFHDITASGAMKGFCTANAILSLKEFVRVNGDPELNKLLEASIDRHISSIEEPARRELLDSMRRIEEGETDVRY